MCDNSITCSNTFGGPFTCHPPSGDPYPASSWVGSDLLQCPTESRSALELCMTNPPTAFGPAVLPGWTCFGSGWAWHCFTLALSPPYPSCMLLPAGQSPPHLGQMDLWAPIQIHSTNWCRGHLNQFKCYLVPIMESSSNHSLIGSLPLSLYH